MTPDTAEVTLRRLVYPPPAPAFATESWRADNAEHLSLGLVVDCETTGLDAFRDALIELALNDLDPPLDRSALDMQVQVAHAHGKQLLVGQVDPPVPSATLCVVSHHRNFIRPLELRTVLRCHHLNLSVLLAGDRCVKRRKSLKGVSETPRYADEPLHLAVLAL